MSDWQVKAILEVKSNAGADAAAGKLQELLGQSTALLPHRSCLAGCVTSPLLALSSSRETAFACSRNLKAFNRKSCNSEGLPIDTQQKTYWKQDSQGTSASWPETHCLCTSES